MTALADLDRPAFGASTGCGAAGNADTPLQRRYAGPRCPQQLILQAQGWDGARPLPTWQLGHLGFELRNRPSVPTQRVITAPVPGAICNLACFDARALVQPSMFGTVRGRLGAPSHLAVAYVCGGCVGGVRIPPTFGLLSTLPTGTPSRSSIRRGKPAGRSLAARGASSAT